MWGSLPIRHHSEFYNKFKMSQFDSKLLSRIHSPSILFQLRFESTAFKKVNDKIT